MENLKYTADQLKLLEDYRQSLLLHKNKSADLFEKAITFISAGALALTLTFHDKIVPAENAIYVIIIGIGWAFLTATLFINLISHYQTSKSLDKTIVEVDDVIGNEITYSRFLEKIEKRNIYINALNLISIILLGLGLLLIIIYTTINLQYGKEKQSENIIDISKSRVKQSDSSNSIMAKDTASIIELKQ